MLGGIFTNPWREMDSMRSASWQPRDRFVLPWDFNIFDGHSRGYNSFGGHDQSESLPANSEAQTAGRSEDTTGRRVHSVHIMKDWESLPRDFKQQSFTSKDHNSQQEARGRSRVRTMERGTQTPRVHSVEIRLEDNNRRRMPTATAAYDRPRNWSLERKEVRVPINKSDSFKAATTTAATAGNAHKAETGKEAETSRVHNVRIVETRKPSLERKQCVDIPQSLIIPVTISSNSGAEATSSSRSDAKNDSKANGVYEPKRENTHNVPINSSDDRGDYIKVMKPVTMHPVRIVYINPPNNDEDSEFKKRKPSVDLSTTDLSTSAEKVNLTPMDTPNLTPLNVEIKQNSPSASKTRPNIAPLNVDIKQSKTCSPVADPTAWTNFNCQGPQPFTSSSSADRGLKITEVKSDGQPEAHASMYRKSVEKEIHVPIVPSYSYEVKRQEKADGGLVGADSEVSQGSRPSAYQRHEDKAGNGDKHVVNIQIESLDSSAPSSAIVSGRSSRSSSVGRRCSISEDAKARLEAMVKNKMEVINRNKYN